MTEEKKYKVLARKYRPQKFEDLVGQELLVKILSNAINNDRLAHAYILTGVRGVGKTTTARLIAMSINCKNRDKKNCEPCGNCDSCKSTTSDSNLDVIEIDAASNTGVDDIREIIDNAEVPIIVDAGVGTASDACVAMELGCDGVLMNTAVACAKNPILMACAMKHAIEAGNKAYEAGRIEKKLRGVPSSPKDGLITDD